MPYGIFVSKDKYHYSSIDKSLKMRTKHIFLITTASFVLCSSGIAWHHFINLSIIPIDVNKTEKLGKLSKLFDEVEVIALETSPISLIGEIRKIIQHKDRFYILDAYSSNAVFVFDNRGKFLHKLGKNGDGPGEYKLPLDFNIFKDKAYVLDGQKIIIYDVDTGQYITTKAIKEFPCQKFIVLGEDLFYFYSASSPYHLIQTNENLNITNFSIPRLNYLRRSGLIEPFTKISDQQYYFRLALNDTLFSITRNQMNPAAVIDFGKFSITNDFLENQRKIVQNDPSPDIPDKVTFIHSFYENSDIIYVSFRANSKLKYALISKCDNTSIVFDDNHLENDISFQSHFPYLFYSNAQEGYFLGYISPEEVDIQKIKNRYPEIKKTKIDKNSNPIILKVKFKNTF